MNDTAENPNDAAKRLEAALERISALTAQAAAARARGEPPPPEIVEVKQRLDALIARLRAGLGNLPE